MIGRMPFAGHRVEKRYRAVHVAVIGDRTRFLLEFDQTLRQRL